MSREIELDYIENLISLNKRLLIVVNGIYKFYDSLCGGRNSFIEVLTSFVH